MSNSITLPEVNPRDRLQNEGWTVDVETKIESALSGTRRSPQHDRV